MTLAVDLVVEPGTVTVRARSGWAARGEVERVRGDGTAEVLAEALRRARVLRTLRRVDLRVVLETARVVLRVRRPGSVGPEGGVRIPAGTDGTVLEVAVEDALLDQVRTGLARRPCCGRVRLELGPLVRAAEVLDLGGPGLEGRPGVIVDVTRAAVTVIQVDGTAVVAARAAPSQDLRAALTAVAVPAVAAAAYSGTPAPDRVRGRAAAPWLHLSAPPGLAEGVRQLLAGALPVGGSLDLLRRGGRPRAR